MPLQPGETIDRYVIESLLGAGGMGEVYRARDPRLQRSVALKVLHLGPGSQGSALGSGPSTTGAERLLREARAAASLEHANVVAVYDVGYVVTASHPEGITYLAMELIKGASLRAYVGDASLAMSERLRWLTDVARALGAAHRAGVVHRDVKPENVMIREDGTVKVLDFGIARRSSSVVDPTSSTAGQSLATMTGRGVVVGTPQYMAPEQLRADVLDGRADQFAWGVMAYELVTGKTPWTLHEGAIALVAQILSHEPPPVGTLAEVPEAVDRAITRALRKDRDARFASMDALIDALAGRPDSFVATRGSGPPRGTPPPPSNETQAFASAPTEAILTPPTGRQLSEASMPPRPRRRIGWRVAAFAIALAAVAAVGVGMRIRTRGAALDPNHAKSGAAPAGCATSKACMDAHGGEPWTCRATDHQCVSLASEDCAVLANPGDLGLDSTVWLGAMYKPATADDVSQVRTIDLARRDFAETLGTLEGTRHIAIVSCDARGDVQRAARHLAEDVQVPAVLVGVTRTPDVIELISKVFEPANILTVLPLSVSPLVTVLPSGPSGRLVYRSTYSSDSLQAPTAAFVESVLEPRLAPAGTKKHLRLAFLHNKSLGSSVFYDRLLTTLTFNGKSVIDNGDDFRDVGYEETAESYGAAVTQLTSFRPDVVLARVSAGAVGGLIEPLEKRWPASTPKPTYVVSQPLLTEMLELVAGDAPLRRRIFGMDCSSNVAANAQFVNHFNQTYGATLTRQEAPSTSYDGMYVLAYAVHALGGHPVSGPSLAQALRRLAGPGRQILVGPQPIFDAYRELASGASIDLEGASGHLELDPVTGESTFPISILCAEPGARGATARVRESGLVYREEAHGFFGTLSCP